MNNQWKNCKSILIIRPDNMGDIIMMTPALKALKSVFACKITVLTSCLGYLITPFIDSIDDTIACNLPWVKSDDHANPGDCISLIEKLKTYEFDAAIISTVYSQNPLPNAMIAFMAGIPLRLAYCRENPYELLTHWVPDEEPLSFIQHQVTRELKLVSHIGAHADDDRLSLHIRESTWSRLVFRLRSEGVDVNKPYFIVHPGVSELKRQYPLSLWVDTVKRLYEESGKQVLITGSKKEKTLADKILKETGEGVFSTAGLLDIEEFISLVSHASTVVSVNTATIHIAAAMQTPVVVVYALTNPQHTPWKVPSVVLPFSVPGNLQSRNELIQFVTKESDEGFIDYPAPAKIVESVLQLLVGQDDVTYAPQFETVS